MNTKIIIILLGEPYSIFSEILGKYFSKKKKNRKKIVLIGNYKIFNEQLKKLKYNINCNKISDINNAEFNKVNFINIDTNLKKIFDKISIKSKKLVSDTFNKALKISKDLKNRIILINGPISKKAFLDKKYYGVTEYLAYKTKRKNEVMLIFNKKFSVSPVTTHLPVKNIAKNITKDKIINNINKINEFYKKNLKIIPRIAVLGLNPHCETTERFSEEDNIIIPAINYLKKDQLNISGPFSADTFFLKSNLRKYDVVIGMYHDQVLTPIKLLYEFKAINITLGLPFLRISPDHGPNENMVGKNISNSDSFDYAMNFIDKLN